MQISNREDKTTNARRDFPNAIDGLTTLSPHLTYSIIEKTFIEQITKKIEAHLQILQLLHCNS